MKKSDSNMNSKHSGLGRREFLKRLGLGGAAVAAAGEDEPVPPAFAGYRRLLLAEAGRSG